MCVITIASKHNHIGRMRMLCGEGKRNLTRQQAVSKVSKEIESKYYHITIHCKSLPAIRRSVKTLFDNFTQKERGKEGQVNTGQGKSLY